MSRSRWVGNLTSLLKDMENFCASNSLRPTAAASDKAAALSQAMCLAHSTSRTKFVQICDSGQLKSLAEIAAERKEVVRAECAEALMGTSDSVFLYVSPFRYPNTACGFLFSASLENEHTDDASASPFDSGGLLTHIVRADPGESPRDFLQRHELPVPEHRSYLAAAMSSLFNEPEDYIEGVDPYWAGPIGLSGATADQRRWTHEVRVPRRVFVPGPHLQAVFTTRSLAARSPVRDLLIWCSREGVDSVIINSPKGDDFAALRRECIAYVRKKLY